MSWDQLQAFRQKHGTVKVQPEVKRESAFKTPPPPPEGEPGTKKRANKMGNKKIVTEEGVFDSEREYKRWVDLKMLARAGHITNLKRQVKFILVPAQVKSDKTKERPVTYTADFTYNDKTGQYVVEDSKGYATRGYIVSRKLMLWVHGIEIQEV